MGVPNYVYLVVVFWIVVYICVYYIIFSNKSTIASVDSPAVGQQAELSKLVRDLAGSEVSFETNPFLSDNCANVVNNFSKKPLFKKGIVIMVAHNIKKEHLVKSVSPCLSLVNCILCFH